MPSNLLGQGTYGVVMEKEQRAVKYFCLGDTELDCLEDWMKEVTIRSVLGCESEVCATLDIDSSSLSISMELFSGDLLDEVSSLVRSNCEVSQIEDFLLHNVLPQVSFQIGMFQQRGLVHLDVTPHNILVRLQKGKYRIALADFGSSRLCQGTFTPSFARKLTTKEFIPPCSGTEKLDYRYDMYGLGQSMLYATRAAGLSMEKLSPKFLQVVDQLTGDYTQIPLPEFFSPSLRCKSVPSFQSVLNRETKRTLANTLFSLLAKKYPSHIVKVCNCITLLLRGSSVLSILKELGDGSIEQNIQLRSFITTFMQVIQDIEAIAAIRSFLTTLMK